MELHSSKRLKLESKPSCSHQQLVGSNLLDNVTSLDSPGSLNDSGNSNPELDFEVLRWAPNFVDKTLLSRAIMKDKNHTILLTAPPRFGKTMAINMLEMFFEIVDNEQKSQKSIIFKDLKIAKCSEECTDNHDCESKRFFHKHFGRYPVISLDLAKLSTLTYDTLLESFKDMITEQFEKYNYLIHKDAENYTWSSENLEHLRLDSFLKYLIPADEDNYWKTASDGKKGLYILRAFKYLIKVLSAYYQTKQTRKKIIILIDEFDAPFMKMLTTRQMNADLQENIIVFIRDLMRVLCKEEKFVGQVVIFSVTALGGMVSLGANNVRRRTFLDKNHDYCKFFGFTKEEVETLVKNTVTDGQQQKALDEIAVWYNNYTILDDKYTTICNPWSVTNYLENLIRKNYWVHAVGSKYICELFKFEKMQKKLFAAVRDNHSISISTTHINLDDISNLRKLNESLLNCIRDEQVDLVLQFLAECGYLNIIKTEDTNWILKIPNEELRKTFRDELYHALLKPKNNLFDIRQQESFVNALESLGCGKKHEPMKYVAFKKSVENLYTNRELPEAHFHFHCDLWMLILGSGKFQCGSELPVKEGCSPKLDLIIITESSTIIIEVKRHKQDSAEKALKQCLQKEYYKAFEHEGNETLMGLHLSDDGKASIRYLENFDWKTTTLPDEHNRKPLIETIVEASHKC